MSILSTYFRRQSRRIMVPPKKIPKNSENIFLEVIWYAEHESEFRFLISYHLG